MAEELYKPIIRKFEERKVYSPLTDNILGADLADVQLTSKFNKGLRFLLFVIDIYSKYPWVVPVKDKKGITITNAFQKTSDESNCKRNKICVDKHSETQWNQFCRIMVWVCIQHIMKENVLFLKDSLEPWKVKVIYTWL